MRYILLVFLLFSTIGDGLKKASRVNAGVQRADQLYRLKEYRQAAKIYQFLIDSLHVTDDELLLNLAHATYQTGNTEQARKYYQRLRDNSNPALQAAALNQLGILAYKDANPEKALYFFKKAIVKYPLDDVARYNYELVQKYTAQNPARTAKNQRPDKTTPAPENQTAPQTGQKTADTGQSDLQNDSDNTGTEPTQEKPQATPGNNPENQDLANKLAAGTEEKVNQGPAGGKDKGVTEENNPQSGNLDNGGNEPLNEKEQQMQTLRQRLSKTDLTAEKATTLLEAMRQAELQYLQQLPRQPSRRPDKNKPDW